MQLLQPTMGQDLPAEVRDALLGLGTSCNDAAVLVDLANGVERFAQRKLECVHVLAHATQTAEDITTATDGWRNRAIAAFARAATRYAVYASRVAEAVGASETPPAPALDHLVPSMLADKFDRLLPVIQFPNDTVAETNAADSITTLLQLRDALEKLVYRRLHGNVLGSYDDLHVDGSADMTDELPRLLHQYATEIVYIVGLLSGVVDPDFG